MTQDSDAIAKILGVKNKRMAGLTSNFYTGKENRSSKKERKRPFIGIASRNFILFSQEKIQKVSNSKIFSPV